MALMDATGSMGNLLQKAKHTVGTVFERATEILKTRGINPAVIRLQFAVYRDYDCLIDKLLHWKLTLKI